MGQQTSPADRPPAPARARRFASVTFAALSAVTALLTASAIVMWTSQHHVSTGKQADSLFVDTLDAFDSDLTAPSNQVTTATVTNVGTDVVTITDIQFALAPPGSGDNVPEAFAASDSATTSPQPPAVPLEIFPGENCKGAVLQPKTDCMVSVRYTSPGQVFNGQIIVTTADGSQRFGTLGASPGPDNSLVADPYVVDFGTLPVGQTSPAQTVTIGASLDGDTWNVVGVSVVDTVPTPGDRADYHITADNCTGQVLNVPEEGGDAIPAAAPEAAAPVAVPNCTIQVTFTPGDAGPRPAFLSVSYCGSPGEGTIGGVFQPGADAASDSSSPSASGPPPVDPNVFCPDGDNPASHHQIIALNGAGHAPSPPPTTTTTTPPPTTTTTTTPPPTTTPPTTTPPTFTPTVTALPPVSPASRTTEVSGTGFPANTQVTFALVALNTPTNANLTGLPNTVTTTTDGSGNFTDKVMLIMPHTQPGLDEILAQAQSGTTLVTATANFLVEPGIQEPPKFAFRH